MFKVGDRVRVKPDLADEVYGFGVLGTVDKIYTDGKDYPIWVIFDGFEASGEFGFEEFELEAVDVAEG